MHPLHLVAFFSFSAAASPLVKRAEPQGVDVSHFQGSIDWNAMAANGVSFAYIKATEGTTFKDSMFSTNYIGATDVGIIRGGYHFAHPDTSDGATQANFFLANGGGWSGDGITLPGAIDLEAGCYGLTASEMVSWIGDFSDTYLSATGRSPAIYTTTSWWNQCTGGSADFGANPLWLAEWAPSMGPLPASWGSATFWQYADSGSNPGDQDLFIGDEGGLQAFASG
ncbi:glycoside hydrolase family 25 protein [Lactarius deliciosus]|nr:glycoside hydrolase family 25 protein [Lactarius deliciosus]